MDEFTIEEEVEWKSILDEYTIEEEEVEWMSSPGQEDEWMGILQRRKVNG